MSSINIPSPPQVVFNAFSTFRSRQCCPLGGRGYYEIEILDISGRYRHRYGLASAAFERVLGAPATGLGDDAASGMVNGMAHAEMHYREQQLLVSVNGSFDAPNGRVFDLAPDAVGDGLFAAFSGYQGKVRYNLGETPFKHAAPSADYVTFSAFDTDT